MESLLATLSRINLEKISIKEYINLTKGPIPDAPKVTTTKLTHTLQSSLHSPNSLIASQPQDGSQFYSTAKSLSGEPVRLL